jgi:hypothetical protein
MSAAAAAVVVLYAAWVAATIANQFPTRCPARLRAADVFGLLPVWTFFAPHPGTTDYYLLYRDRLRDGSLDPWREVELKPAENGLRLALWNPGKRRHKAVSDVVGALLRSRGRHGEGLVVTVPYILVLNAVTARPHAPGATGTQFMIMEHGGFAAGPERSRVLVLSAIHGLR